MSLWRSNCGFTGECVCVWVWKQERSKCTYFFSSILHFHVLHVLMCLVLQRGHYKCDFMEWLYGPMSHSPKPQEKKKERIIIPAPPVLCKCGVEAHYGLVPSKRGIGHWCDHMVDYDEVGIVLENFYWNLWHVVAYLFMLNRALKNANGSLIMVEKNIGIQSRRSK